MRDSYLAPFVRICMEPKGPRDQLLRGDFESAAGDLIGFSARMEQQQKRIVDERKSLAEAKPPQTLEDKVDEWAKKAVSTYADQIRAGGRHAGPREAADKAVDEVWRDSGAIGILLEGASSGPGLAEVTYQLGLCKHEKAEQPGAHGHAAAPAWGEQGPGPGGPGLRDGVDGRPGLVEKVRRRPSGRSPNRPSTCPGRAAAVRQMHTHAQAIIGDWKGALATCDDAREPPLEPLEPLAALYHAQQLKKAHAADMH